VRRSWPAPSEPTGDVSLWVRSECRGVLRRSAARLSRRGLRGSSRKSCQGITPFGILRRRTQQGAAPCSSLELLAGVLVLQRLRPLALVHVADGNPVQLACQTRRLASRGVEWLRRRHYAGECRGLWRCLGMRPASTSDLQFRCSVTLDVPRCLALFRITLGSKSRPTSHIGMPPTARRAVPWSPGSRTASGPRTSASATRRRQAETRQATSRADRLTGGCAEGARSAGKGGSGLGESRDVAQRSYVTDPAFGGMSRLVLAR
jgi:hypothetical protein